MERPACDICGSALNEPAYGTFAIGCSCSKCGTTYDTYYRRDGGLIEVPPAWGRCVGVTHEPFSIEKNEHFDVRGETYYIFQADDGSIRRVHIECIPFRDQTPRPPGLPERIKYYHYLNVDVWPPACIQPNPTSDDHS